MVFKMGTNFMSAFKDVLRKFEKIGSTPDQKLRQYKNYSRSVSTNQRSNKNLNSIPFEEQRLTDELWSILRCPNCKGILKRTATGAQCVKCKDKYPLSKFGQLDLRLQRKKTYSMNFEIDVRPLPNYNIVQLRLPINPLAETEISRKGSGCITPELLSYFPKSIDSNSLMLDLGCGSTRNRYECEKAGYKYIGLDFESSEATILGDAHALPFENKSFEFVLSIAVLEHLRYPFVALSEINRVLKEGALFIGTVAFLEPHHGNSFYHFTHLGVINALEASNFRIKAVATNPEWNALTAQATMALFPKMPPLLIRFTLAPLRAICAIWWKIASIVYPAKTNKIKNRINMAGSFMFIAEKR
jgi:SAM-dependent methyltransferase